MVKIKICGIRREEDVRCVNTHLPDYVGFVFAKSRRQVSPLEAKMLAGSLNASIKKAGVFVNEEASKIAEIVAECGLDVVQLHGDETPEYIVDLRLKLGRLNQKGRPLLASGPPEPEKAAPFGPKVEIWKAVRVKDKSSLDKLKNYEADKFLLDAYSEGNYGGTGETFDWSLAVEAKKYGSIVLAGGLNSQNIKEAVSIVKPCVVDVSSGVETDGRKDEAKIRDFINMARYHAY